MKIIHLSILSLFFLVGIKQTNAQTAQKIAVERKEATPVKETEIKEAPRAEAITPQPIQHTEITPVKENETQVAAPATPVEEHKAGPAEQVEWVKTTPEQVKPTQTANTNSQNNTTQPAKPAFKMPVYNGQVKPAMKRIAFKPMVIDTTKK